MTKEAKPTVAGWDEAVRVSGLGSRAALRRKARDAGLHVLRSATTGEIFFYREDLERIRAEVEKPTLPGESVIEARDRLICELREERDEARLDRNRLRQLLRKWQAQGCGWADHIKYHYAWADELEAALRGKPVPRRKQGKKWAFNPQTDAVEHLYVTGKGEDWTRACDGCGNGRGLDSQGGRDRCARCLEVEKTALGGKVTPPRRAR